MNPDTLELLKAVADSSSHLRSAEERAAWSNDRVSELNDQLATAKADLARADRAAAQAKEEHDRIAEDWRLWRAAMEKENE